MPFRDKQENATHLLVFVKSALVPELLLLLVLEEANHEGRRLPVARALLECRLLLQRASQVEEVQSIVARWLAPYHPSTVLAVGFFSLMRPTLRRHKKLPGSTPRPIFVCAKTRVPFDSAFLLRAKNAREFHTHGHVYMQRIAIHMQRSGRRRL